eukprot:scaffold12882_cov61-Phaeocystis_antarctica.AAC.2
MRGPARVALPYRLGAVAGANKKRASSSAVRWESTCITASLSSERSMILVREVPSYRGKATKTTLRPTLLLCLKRGDNPHCVVWALLECPLACR